MFDIIAARHSGKFSAGIRGYPGAGWIKPGMPACQLFFQTTRYKSERRTSRCGLFSVGWSVGRQLKRKHLLQY
jgi:hypothetical protein